MDTPATERLRINFSWLVKLRWAAGLGQLATIVGVQWGLGIPLHLGPLLLLVAIELASNSFLEVYRLRWLDAGPLSPPPSERLLGLIMTFDIALLTALLYWSGGPNNPFSLFYLVNLTLAAVLLPPRWVWFGAALAACGFAMLFPFHEPLPALGNVFTTSRGALPAAPGVDETTTRGRGMLAAFAAAMAIITYFITRVTTELEQREEELKQAQRRKAESEKLEALATLAAGAAHELASPLSTIAVVAKELERELDRTQAGEGVVEDARLIRNEVGRCRTILDHMATEAGESAGELNVWMTLGDLLLAARNGLREASRVDLRLDPETARARVQAPRHALAQAIRGLFKNGLDASPDDQSIRVTASLGSGKAHVLIQDSGGGMNEDTLLRVGNPFFTTKEPGRGMGLGVFLARKVVERCGGSFKMVSTVGKGTVVHLDLPADFTAVVHRGG